MAHWTINHSSYTGSVTVGATPSSKNTSTSSINLTATFTLGSHNKTVSLIHTGAANTVTLSDGDLMNGWFAVMCYNCHTEKLSGIIGNSKLSGSTENELRGKQAFWETLKFPEVNLLASNPLKTKIQGLTINPVPKSAAYAVMDKTDLLHKSNPPMWKFRVTALNIAGALTRILYGADVLDASHNFLSYLDAWEGHLYTNSSGSFTAFEVLYFTNSVSGIDELYDKSYKITFSAPQTSLTFEVTPSLVTVYDANKTNVMGSWEFGDYNNNGLNLSSNGNFSVLYASLYTPCIIESTHCTIDNIELSVS